VKRCGNGICYERNLHLQFQITHDVSTSLIHNHKKKKKKKKKRTLRIMDLQGNTKEKNDSCAIIFGKLLENFFSHPYILG